MTLNDHLVETGIDLSKDVGFIAEEREGDREFQAIAARYGRVLTNQQIAVIDQADLEEYDPNFDLVMRVGSGTEMKLYVLRMILGASVYEIDGNSVMVATTHSRISIGQSQQFMDEVARVWCLLEG